MSVHPRFHEFLGRTGGDGAACARPAAGASAGPAGAAAVVDDSIIRSSVVA